MPDPIFHFFLFIVVFLLAIFYLKSLLFQSDFGMKWSTLSTKFCQIPLTALFTYTGYTKKEPILLTARMGPFLLLLTSKH
jgi:hypothetical protein